MRKMKKIALATALTTIALGGGILATNSVSAQSDILDKLSMEAGMSIRMGNPEGLRFTAKIAMSESEMTSAGIKEVGTILMPADKVNGMLEYNEKNGTAEALLIPTEKYAQSTEDACTWYSVLVNNGETGKFPVEFYNTPIMGRAYVKYSDGTYKYSENTVTRSIGYVATMETLNGGTSSVITSIADATIREIAVKDNYLVGDTAQQAQVQFGGQAIEAIEGVTVSVVWSVEGDAVSVSQDGVVTPVKEGNATVSATVSVNGGTPTTVSKSVSVALRTTEVSETYFAVRRSDDNGNVVFNDYTYTLTDSNVTSLTIGGNEVATSDYVVDGNTLTVKGNAFTGVDTQANWYKAQDLVVMTATEKVKVTFGKIATFGVTKASDINVGNVALAAPLMKAGGWEDGARTKDVQNGKSWTGYFILENDIDFGFEIIKHNASCENTGVAGATGFTGVFEGQNYAFKNFCLYDDNNSFFGRIVGGAVVENVKFINFRTTGSSRWHSNFGLFDGCYGNVRNIYVEAVADDTSPVLGVFKGDATLTNSTIKVDCGALAYNAENAGNGVFKGSADMTGTTIYTTYPVDTAQAKKATVVRWAGDYYTTKVDAEDGSIKDNDAFAVQVEGALQSVKLYESVNSATDITAKATQNGNTVSVNVNDYIGKKGVTIVVKTDKETKAKTLDIATYAVDDMSDMTITGTSLTKARFLQVLHETAVNNYVILANDILCETMQTMQTGGGCAQAGTSVVKNSATFDGRGLMVDNIQLYANIGAWSSIFGYVDGMNINDVSFTNVKGGTGYSYGFFGHKSNVILTNVFIEGTAGTKSSKDHTALLGSFAGYCNFINCTFVVRTHTGDDVSTLQRALRSTDGRTCDFSTTKIYTDYDTPSNFTMQKYSIAEWDALNS